MKSIFLFACSMMILTVTSYSNTPPALEDAALAEKVNEKLYLSGKNTPAQYATDKALNFQSWVYKRICLGQYKLGDTNALITARLYLKGVLTDAEQGFAWPIKYPQQFDLPYMVKKPVIDGDVGEIEWRDALCFQGEYPKGNITKTLSDINWKMCWDEEFLYLAAIIPDTNIISIDYDKAKNVYPWYGDALEVFVMPNKRFRSYWEVVVNPSNRVVDGLHFIESFTSVSGLDEAMKGLITRTKILNGGFSVELALPFGEFPGYFQGNVPKAGEQITFNMIRINKQYQQSDFSGFVPFLYDGHNVHGYPIFILKTTSKVR